MSDAPDLQALARRYLDLWQDQLTAVATDAALAETMAQAFAAMSRGAAAAAEAAGTVQGKDGSHGAPAPAPRAATAGTASAGPDGGADHLARRVAALERRVADLEAALAAARGGTGKPGRRRKS